MSTGHDIEAQGVAYLTEYLRARGRVVEPRRTKTFDLVVDGLDAEVKAKGKPFGHLDFVSLTSKQLRCIARETPFKLFVVCGLNASDPALREVIEIDSVRLANVAPKVETHYYYDRAALEVAAGRSQPSPSPTTRSPSIKTLLKAVFAARGDRWSQATRDVAETDAVRVLEALLAERSSAEVIHALNRHGFRGESFAYLLKPLIDEATRRRVTRLGRKRTT